LRKGGSIRIFVSTSSFGSQGREPLSLLKGAGLQTRLNPLGRRVTPEELVRLAQGCVGLIAGTERIDRSTLAQLPDLRVISRCGAGLDTINLLAARERGIWVFNTPEAPVESVAELTLALMLGVLRRIGDANQTVHAGRWKPLMGRLLKGKTVGLIGLGRIGRRLAELLGPFRVRLLARDKFPDRKFAKRHGIRLVNLRNLIASSDVVSLHIPLEEETRGMIGPRELGAMKRGAVLLNTARGELVNTRALINALRSGYLAGAGLDVFEQEPYRGPLAACPNALLTCHMGSYAAETRAAMELQAVKNLLLGLHSLRS
jgi:D-3-phosphoglycerate dehydrogenase